MPNERPEPELVNVVHPLFDKYIDPPDGLRERRVFEELGGDLDTLERGLDELTRVVRRYEDDESLGDLMPQARSAKLAEVLRKPVERIHRLTAARLEKAEEDITRKEKWLLASVDRKEPPEPTVEELLGEMRLDGRLRELRGALAAQPENARLALVASAGITRGDLAPLWAVLGAPLPLAEPGEVDRLKGRIVEARWPERLEVVALRKRVHRVVLEFVHAARAYAAASANSLQNQHGLPGPLVAVSANGLEVIDREPQQRTAA